MGNWIFPAYSVMSCLTQIISAEIFTHNLQDINYTFSKQTSKLTSTSIYQVISLPSHTITKSTNVSASIQYRHLYCWVEWFRGSERVWVFTELWIPNPPLIVTCPQKSSFILSKLQFTSHWTSIWVTLEDCCEDSTQPQESGE